MKKHIIILILAIVFISNTNAQNTNIQYDIYCNSRYEFCAQYPSEILFPQGETDAQDGQIFISKNKQNELRVYRQFIDIGNDLNELTLKYQFNKEIKENKNSIIYKKLGKDFFVISGFYSKHQIYYQKSFVREGGLITCILIYNKSEKELYNKIAENVFKSFKKPI